MSQKLVHFVFELGKYLFTCFGLDDRLYFKVTDVNVFVGVKKYHYDDTPKTTLAELFHTESLHFLPRPRQSTRARLFDVETCIGFVSLRDEAKAQILKYILLHDLPVIFYSAGPPVGGLPKVSLLGKFHPLRSRCKPMSKTLKELQDSHGRFPPLPLVVPKREWDEETLPGGQDVSDVTVQTDLPATKDAQVQTDLASPFPEKISIAYPSGEVWCFNVRGVEH